jgi:hypothetical protein
MVVGVISSTSTMIIVSLLTQSKYPVPENVLELIEESSLVRLIPNNISSASNNSIAIQALEIKKFLGKNE